MAPHQISVPNGALYAERPPGNRRWDTPPSDSEQASDSSISSRMGQHQQSTEAPNGTAGQGSQARTAPKPTKKSLTFVTISHPEEARSEKNLKTVRQTAMNYSLATNPAHKVARKRPKDDAVPRRRRDTDEDDIVEIVTGREVKAQTRNFGPSLTGEEPVEEQDVSIREPAFSELFPYIPTERKTNKLVTPPHWPVSYQRPADPPRHWSGSLKNYDPPFVWPLASHGHGLDPFDSLPKPDNPLVNVYKLKHNCVEFFSSEGLRKYWASRAMDNRLFFFSALCIAARHEDAQREINSPMTMAIETEVISLMNQIQQDPLQTASDDSIAAVLHLASSQNYQPEDSSFHWYGFLLTLIGQRGGFQGLITFPALAWMCTLNCVCSSVIREVQPLPPFFMAAGLQLEAAKENPFILESPVCAEATGFAQITYSPLCSKPLADLLELMQRLCAIVTSEDTSRPATEQYASQRDLIHMQLLAFQPASLPGHAASLDWIYESCRVAAMILEKSIYHATSFSQAVVKTNLVAQLKSALRKTDRDKLWGDMAGCLTWIGFIGAAAARCSPERQWMVGIATRCAIKHSFSHPDSIIRSAYKMLQIQQFNAMRSSPGAEASKGLKRSVT